MSGFTSNVRSKAELTDDTWSEGNVSMSSSHRTPHSPYKRTSPSPSSMMEGWSPAPYSTEEIDTPSFKRQCSVISPPPLSLDDPEDIGDDNEGFSPVLFETQEAVSRVVGRHLSREEESFVERAKKAIGFLQEDFLSQELRNQLVRNLARGTYCIQDLDQDQKRVVEECVTHGLFANSAIAEEIFGYLAGGSFGQPLAIFKPQDEVRGAINCQAKKRDNQIAKHGIVPHFEIANEVIAAGLHDLGHMVLETTLKGPFYDCARSKHHMMTKKGAVVEFLPQTRDIGHIRRDRMPSIPLQTLQDMAILDISLCNTDRNLGNVMVSEVDPEIFHPIDQALLLPAEFKSPAIFAWSAWAGSEDPFTEKSLEKIANLDFERDAAKILSTYPDYPQASLETMKISYYLLKKGTEAGWTPRQIGDLLSGEPSWMCIEYNTVIMTYGRDPDILYTHMQHAIDEKILPN